MSWEPSLQEELPLVVGRGRHDAEEHEAAELKKIQGPWSL